MCFFSPKKKDRRELPHCLQGMYIWLFVGFSNDHDNRMLLQIQLEKSNYWRSVRFRKKLEQPDAEWDDPPSP
jgi:hypothetical protein